VQEHLITEDNIRYFDKDGFELTKLEQEFYVCNEFKDRLNTCLNHLCWQEQWFEIESDNFVLDHSIVLHRCSFIDEAREQLLRNIKKVPRVSYLLQTPSKWGLDLSLDFIDNNGLLTEVIHIEFDTKTYHEFLQLKEEFENFILSTDWYHVYRYLDRHRNEWESLVGFEQNDWKAKHLGFKKAEVTHKAI
jgi:hypothetical protein